jgi:hypothetical protein
MSERDVVFDTPFNVIAAFPPGGDISIAVYDLTRSGIPNSAVTVHRPGDGSTGDELAELEAEIQDELDSSWGLPSGPQAKGAFAVGAILGVAGIVLGLLIGFAWAYGFASGLSRLGRILIATGLVGLAGATVGVVAGGGGLNRPHGEEHDTGTQPEVAERDFLVGVHLDDPAAADRAAARLRDLGAERVHLIDGHGVPLPPEAKHPRPADPAGWWWRNAGHG